MKRNSAKAGMLAAMSIFGTVGIFVRYIPMASAPIAFFRGLVGFLFLLAVMALSGKKPDRQSIRENGKILLLSGAAIGANWILLFEAYRYTTVATATICYYLAPMLLVLASPFLGEKLTGKKLALSGLAMLGMVFVSGVLRGSVSGGRGILCGVGAAVLYATAMFLNKKLDGVSSYDRTVVQLGAAAAVILPYCLLSGGFDLSGMAFGGYLALGVVCVVHTGLAYWLYFGSMKQLPAQTVAIFSYLDPVIAILLSALWLSEPIGWQETVGAMLILGSALISEMPMQKSGGNFAKKG